MNIVTMDFIGLLFHLTVPDFILCIQCRLLNVRILFYTQEFALRSDLFFSPYFTHVQILIKYMYRTENKHFEFYSYPNTK